MKKIFIVFCLLFSVGSQAFDAKAIYNEKLIDKDTGVYEESGYLFFVIHQPCLTTKKYAGTKESKAAEKAFYELLVKTAKRYNLSFDKASIQFGGELQSKIYDNISMSENVLSKITHRLIFDRDSKNKTCMREYVKISSLKNFGQNKVKISDSQVFNVAVGLLFEAVIEEDYLRVVDYLSEFDLPSLADIYKTKLEQEAYPFNLLYGDVLKSQSECINEKYCMVPPPPFNKYDVNSVISMTLKVKGLIKAQVFHPSIDLSNELFNEANNNFEKGFNQEKIVQNLILSINLNNQNSEAWKLLSNMYRAWHKNDEALIMAIQYAIQSDEQIESWVYLLKTLQPVDPQEAKRLQKVLLLMANKTKLTDWAQSQIKEYK